MKKLLNIGLLFLLALAGASCDSFVEDVDLPIDSIDESQLDTESQIPFVIAGVESRFATSYDRVTLFAGGLSDELFFDTNVPNATFPTYDEMDKGDIEFANNSNDGLYQDIGELMLFTKVLEERIGRITFEDPDLKKQALFIANFYAGMARYFLAAYYGLTEEQGGGVIDAGPFIPSNEMYAQAIEKLNTAKANADAYEARVTNTLIARIRLFEGRYADARSAALQGLQEGDDPFQSLHTPENTNEWYFGSGRGRTQFVADWRFHDYVEADPDEANRLQLETITGTDGTVYWRQARYLLRESPINFATWQENELMLAELDLREGEAGSALGRINTVRASHGLADLESADLDVLIEERDKELFTMGMRLPDQRRFGLWHLGAGTWKYLPITQSERNGNENL